MESKRMSIAQDCQRVVWMEALSRGGAERASRGSWAGPASSTENGSAGAHGKSRPRGPLTHPSMVTPPWPSRERHIPTATALLAVAAGVKQKWGRSFTCDATLSNPRGRAIFLGGGGQNILLRSEGVEQRCMVRTEKRKEMVDSKDSKKKSRTVGMIFF